MLEIKDKDVKFAFEQLLGSYNKISWKDHLDLHNPVLNRFWAIEGVGGAELKGPKDSEEFYEELANFIRITEFGFSAIYSAAGKKLPKVEEKHIDQVVHRGNGFHDFEIVGELQRRNKFFGETIIQFEEDFSLHTFTRYAVFLVLKSLLVAADESLGQS